jgi:anhydro-N-acetylmuramic acid kinase
MSGTSMDAVDAVLVDLPDSAANPPQIVACTGLPIAPELRRELLGLRHAPHNILEQMMRLDVELGRLFATATLNVLQKAGVHATQVTAIGSHGQTIFHQPLGTHPTSVQLGDPNVIAELTGITTVADFRRRDIAAGGQGAPLVPAFHQAVFQSAEKTRVVLNIGGIANITILPADIHQRVTGFDTGPGNALMDAWATEHLGAPRDDHGRWAASGAVHQPLLEILLKDPYFSMVPPKSTGREYFHLEWLRSALRIGKMAVVPSHDIQATLCELTAVSITQAIITYAADAQQVLVCGGGIYNQTLFLRLHELLKPREVLSTSAFGIDPDWVEAVAFAWLAKQTMEGKPGNVPSVTGARHLRVLGGVYRA